MNFPNHQIEVEIRTGVGAGIGIHTDTDQEVENQKVKGRQITQSAYLPFLCQLCFRSFSNIDRREQEPRSRHVHSRLVYVS
jgi:hypothetical protein